MKIAILTSGGDSQGMNAAIRAVAKAAMSKGWEVYGIKRGYKGMLEDNIYIMTPLDVANIAGKNITDGIIKGISFIATYVILSMIIFLKQKH